MINTLYLSKISDPSWHKKLVEDIWHKGFVILPHFLTETAFATLSQEARDLQGKKSKELAGSLAYTLATSDIFMSLFDGMHKYRCAKEHKEYIPLDKEKQVMGFPYKDARDGKKTQETEYHYDGAYVNATLAIVMPETGGELIAFPNLRTSKNALLIKIFSRALRHIPFLRQVVPHVIARSTPNDLCLFFGDRTFHGVEPIGGGERLIMTINAHW